MKFLLGSVVACLAAVNAQVFDATVLVKPLAGKKRGRALKPGNAMLGSNKCTWGPSYWCASEDNAEECGFDFAECPVVKENSDSSDWTSADCRSGPSFFCASPEKASYCNYDYAKCDVYFDDDFNSIPQATGTTVGATRYVSSSYPSTTRYISGTTLPATTLPAYTTYPSSTLSATTLPATTRYVSGTVSTPTSYIAPSRTISTGTGYVTASTLPATTTTIGGTRYYG